MEMERFDSLSNALNAYLQRRKTQYAVMIDGSWGVGKTHYILNALIPGHKVCNFHYLSLYGLKSAQDIDQKIRPLLNNQNSGADNKEVICLDDLERWHGDIDHCLAYVNQLVEHEHCKCILIGNLDELSDDNAVAFSRSQEKTVRHIVQFSPPMTEILNISLSMVEYRSAASRHFVRALIRNNAEILNRYLEQISMRNIRIITEALQFCEIIYRHQAKALKASKGLAFTYLMSLISIVVLVKRNFLENGQRKKLLDGDHENNKGFKFLSEIGYFENELSNGLTDESKYLLDTAFYRLDKISLRGICSIVKNGFYVKSDFKGEFDQWIDEQHYESYLDRDRYYEMENDQAVEVFERALCALTKNLEVTNPVTLLLLSERVVEDIANGAIDYDPVLFKNQIVAAVDKLCKTGAMEIVEVRLFDLAGERFRNCRGIYNYIIKRNQDCRDNQRQAEMAGFWLKIFDNPELSESLITRYPPASVLAESSNYKDVIRSLESLSNIQLNRLVNWVTSGLEKSGFPTDKEAIENLNNLSRLIIRQYGNRVGIRSNHFRRLSHALNTRNKSEEAS
ncbi:MAG: hypothetical protein ACI845_000409 [Gammaproteobacteria bacterium]|jgi:hypothetical protein